MNFCRSTCYSLLFVTVSALTVTGCSSSMPSDPQPVETAEPVSSAADTNVDASPKPGWGDFAVVQEDVSPSWWRVALLWPVNRVLDLVDVVRVDVGAGIAWGGMVRVTKSGQAAYRRMYPLSIRVGLFGRQMPLIIESEDEIGFGSSLNVDEDRNVCQFELGVGADLLLGGYGGICFDEVPDLIAGFFFFDLSGDDRR